MVSAPAEVKPAWLCCFHRLQRNGEGVHRRYDFSGRAQLFLIATKAGGRWHLASRGHVCTYRLVLASDKVAYNLQQCNTCLRESATRDQ